MRNLGKWILMWGFLVFVLWDFFFLFLCWYIDFILGSFIVILIFICSFLEGEDGEDIVKIR